MTNMQTGEIISVGTELLLGQIVDTDAPVMAQILAECGIGCQRRATVGDNLDRLVETLKGSLSRSDIVVTIGGLGPTQDDLTRDGIAAALGEKLVRNATYETDLRNWFADRGYTFAESNAKQADVPESGRMIENPNGTAPGLICEKGGKIVIALPGPPGEFIPMAHGPVRTFLEGLGGGVIHSRVLRVIGIGESTLEEMIQHLIDQENPTVAPYAHTGEVHLRVTSRATTKALADELIEPVHQEISKILGSHLYGTDQTSLEESVVHLLSKQSRTLASAESVTGGQFATRITAIPGASKVFVGGAVAYTPSAKTLLTDVPADLIEQFGAVSAEVTDALATGIRARLGTDYAVAITGNAGPTVDTGDKQVGQVFIAIASSTGTKVGSHRFRGTRNDIQRRATQTALSDLRELISE